MMIYENDKIIRRLHGGHHELQLGLYTKIMFLQPLGTEISINIDFVTPHIRRTSTLEGTLAKTPFKHIS